MLKRIYQAGVLAYLLLVLIAAVFYLQRTVFIDVSFLLFDILKNDALAIQVHRFGVVFTQWAPLLAGKAGVSLKTVALFYSAWVMFYYFLCYLLAGYVLKNYRVALVLLLFNVLIFSDSFYWMQAELQQGLGFMLLVFAYITRPVKGYRTLAEYILIVAGSITMVFFHPLIYIIALYFLLYLALRKERDISRRILAFVAICVVLCVLVKNKYFQSQYDADAMRNARGFFDMLPHYFSFSSTKNFIHNCLYKYYWLPVLSVMIVYLYVRKKRFAELTVFLAFGGGYLLLVNTSYRENVTDFYIENLYLPMAVIAGVPFIYDVLPWLGKRKYLPQVLMGLIMITGIARIYMSSKPFTARLRWEENFLSRHKDEKLIIDKSKVPMDTLMMNWGTPYEFWLLSMIKYNKVSSIMMADKVEDWIVPAWDRKTFITTFSREAYEWFNSPYFIFTDTTTHYTILK